MGVDTIIWLSAVLVFASVVVKMLTASFISRQKRELDLLQAELRKRQAHLETVLEQRQSVEQNLEFFERRKEEDTEALEKLREVVVGLEEADRKYVEEHGPDPDAEELEGAPVAASSGDGDSATESAADEGEGQATTDQVAAATLSSPIAVVPTTLKDPDKLFLPDAIVTELIDFGLTLIDRSVLTQKAADAGLDLGKILEGEEYFKLDAVGDIQLIAVINTRMRGNGVGSATCRVVQIPSGQIVLSTSYDQPGSTDTSADFEPLSKTARTLARSIHEVLKGGETS